MSEHEDEWTTEQVGEHVERREKDGVVELRCTVCERIHIPELSVRGDDTLGAMAAEDAFECHPDGELQREPEPCDRVLDTDDDELKTVIGRPSEEHAVVVPEEATLLCKIGVNDSVTMVCVPVDRLRVVEDKPSEVLRKVGAAQ